MKRTNYLRISTWCLSFFLIFTFVSNLYCARPPISYETIGRLSYESPLESSNTAWRQVKEYDFPWVSPQYIIGWQRTINSSFNAGIYVSIFPSMSPFEPQEYKNLMYYALSDKFKVSLASQKLITISGYYAESCAIASANTGNGLGFEVGNIPTTIEYVIIQLEGEPPNFYYHPAVLIIFTVPSKFYNEIYPEFNKFIADFHIEPLPGGPPTGTIITNGSPSGTIIYNKPTISVNTNEDATCKFDFYNKSYEEMSYTLSGNDKIHSYTFDEALSDGKYTIFVKAKDNSGKISLDSYSWNITIASAGEVEPITKTHKKPFAVGFQRSLNGIEGLTLSYQGYDWNPFLMMGGNFTRSDTINSKLNLGFGFNLDLVEINNLSHSGTGRLTVQLGGLAGIHLEKTQKPDFFIELPLKLKYEFSNTISIWTAVGIGYTSDSDEMVIPFRDRIPVGIEISF